MWCLIWQWMVREMWRWWVCEIGWKKGVVAPCFVCVCAESSAGWNDCHLSQATMAEWCASKMGPKNIAQWCVPEKAVWALYFEYARVNHMLVQYHLMNIMKYIIWQAYLPYVLKSLMLWRSGLYAWLAQGKSQNRNRAFEFGINSRMAVAKKLNHGTLQRTLQERYIYT